MLQSKVAGTLFLVFGLVLFAIAFRPQLRAGISNFALFTAMSTLLILLGAYHVRIARTRANAISEQPANASPLRRLWFPARYYTSKSLLWQSRLMGIMMIATGLTTAFAALVAYRHAW